MFNIGRDRGCRTGPVPVSVCVCVTVSWVDGGGVTRSRPTFETASRSTVAPEFVGTITALAATDLPVLMTIEQTARLLGISRSAAYRAVAAGHIPTVRFGRRLFVPPRTAARDARPRTADRPCRRRGQQLNRPCTGRRASPAARRPQRGGSRGRVAAGHRSSWTAHDRSGRPVTRKSNSEAEGVCEQLDWIRREQFTYYLTIAYMVTDPTDWPRSDARSTAASKPRSAWHRRDRPVPTPTRVPRPTPNRNDKPWPCWMRSAIASTPPSTGSDSPSPYGTDVTKSPHRGAATPGHNACAPARSYVRNEASSRIDQPGHTGGCAQVSRSPELVNVQLLHLRS